MPSLRPLLAADDLVVAPGVYDGLTARLAAQHGFAALYMTGAGTAAAAGYPDYGLLTMSEMVANAAQLAEAVDVPLIADADTGYGNELNVVRTVRAYSRVGVAALHIEDQTFPKRCGHLAGKQIVTRDDWLGKIKAAVECRPDDDLVVIARTDARAVAGFDEAVERGRAAFDAGADMVFVEALETIEEIETVPRLVGGPCLFNVVPGGRSPEVSFAKLHEWGYRLAICPGVLLWPVVAACDTALSALAEQVPVTARTAVQVDNVADERHPAGNGPAALFDRVGAADWDELRQRFAAGEPLDGTGA
jgi:2-methylisocitrate lyase-like PEP mutase family enzyme